MTAQTCAIQPFARRFQCFCVGTGKTGTRSMAGLFAKEYRAAHEPASAQLIATILEYGDRHSVPGGSLRQDRPSQVALRAFLRKRDEGLGLELESDGTLYHFLDLLVEDFPESKIVLTIRDCYTWLDSVFNHHLANRPDGFWHDFDDFNFASWGFQHERFEQTLADRGLRTLRHYLTHWSTHNMNVIARSPPERLCVVRTDRIYHSAHEIAALLRISESTLDLTRCHLGRNPKRFGLLSQIDPAFLEQCVQECCQPLMRQFFPEITCFEDVDLRNGAPLSVSALGE